MSENADSVMRRSCEDSIGELDGRMMGIRMVA